jgi:hypothetical protein
MKYENPRKFYVAAEPPVSNYPGMVTTRSIDNKIIKKRLKRAI